MEHCLNCKAETEKSHLYCPACGQKNGLPRLTLKEIGYEIFHSLSDTKGLLHLILHLLQNPGLVALEYVSGKRKKYFPPFSFLILVIGLASLLLKESQVISHQAGTKIGGVGQFMDEHVNLLMFLNIPVIALLNRFFFPKYGFNVAEHAVLVAFLSGIKSIFFSLFVFPLLYFYSTIYYQLLGIYTLLWFMYFNWGNAQFLQSSKFVDRFKSVLVLLLAQLFSILLVAVVLFVFKRESFPNH